MSRIPVTVLTGHLGAGKTTLLNRILAEPHGRRYAVIVNEFGELGIDGDLIMGVKEEIFTLNNGCLCCSVRGDLVRTLKLLIANDDQLDGIIIETTGLADPAPVAQTFFADPEINRGTRLDTVITVADARNLPLRLQDSFEAAAQIASADLVLLNKTDLVSADEIDAVEAQIRSINHFADIRRTIHSKLPIAELLDRHAFDLRRVIERMPHLLAADRQRHNDTIESVSLQAGRPLERDRFLRWVDSLLALHGEDILRIKGILHLAGADRPFVFQSVHRIMDGDFIGEWPIPAPGSKLVVIGRNLDPGRLRRNFDGCQLSR